MDLMLSRDELLLVASMFKRTHVPGLELNPAEASLAPAEQQRRRQVAAYSLRQRGIAKMADGKPQVHASVLSLVGICAHAQKTVVVHQLDAANKAARAVVHTLGKDAVLRRMTAPDIYKLTGLPDQKAIVTELLTLMAANGVPEPAPMSISLADDGLNAGREAARAGDISAARSAFARAGADAGAARALAGFFSSAHTLSMVHVMQAQAASLNIQGVTIATGSASAWLMVELAGQPAASRRWSLMAVSTDTLRKFWEGITREA